MIVTDVNVAAYLLIEGPFTGAAQGVLMRDPEWVAPLLWRSELVNVLATSVRGRLLDERRAMEVLRVAPIFVDPPPVRIADEDILRLSISSKVATYDCEYVALARALNVLLVTADQQVVTKFADTAIDIREFASGR